ncbi:MAG: GerMN domain-containing protein [Chloroflexi bacterium]|nr:GerMN domain-containing protein [Chloroflexota bacterium]
MSESTPTGQGYCPYLGLKQNRAIRFSSPTPEHRCYVSGEAIEIPVDQASFCLARNHVQCPLYMGLTLPSTPVASSAPVAAVAPPGGLRGWFSTLSPRDRAIYALMIAMLAIIVLIYLFAGLQSLNSGLSIVPTAAAPLPTSGGAAGVPKTVTTTPSATVLPATTVPPTPTALPTSTPSPQPSPSPTPEPALIVPTAIPTLPAASPTVTPSAAPIVPATQTTQPPATPTATQTAAPAVSPVPPPTAVPPASAPVAPPPSLPTLAPRPPAPTAAPAIRNERVWLYFGDTTRTLFVPTQRLVQVQDRQVATAAVRALIEGPRDGLEGLVDPAAQLLGIQISGGVATVNFDREPHLNGDPRGLYAIVLTLTHFESIDRVQFQVNGRNIGIGGSGPIGRPVVNPLNPDGLPVNYATTEFLPTYYLANDGYHTIRIIRMVPKTRQVAEGTVRALIEGPGEFGYAVQRTIPEGTELRSISISQGIVRLDLSARFAEAGNRGYAVRTLVESLTTLPRVTGVQIFVEGRSLGEWWGEPYGQVFPKPLINPE